MNAIEYSILVAAAYLAGAVPFGFLIGKLHGVDIRKAGSGNIGATNVTRSVGRTAGKICFALDFLKGVAPVAVAGLLFPDSAWPALAAGLATILGHVFPVYLGFKGGKGVSTAAGVAFALAPWPLLSALAIWAAAFLISRYVSLASVIAAASLPVGAAVYGFCGVGSAAARSGVTLGFLALIALFVIVRHRSNIRRLLNGTESRFEKKKKTKEKNGADL